MLSEPTALVLYHLAETQRITKCSAVSSLSTKIEDYLSSVDLKTVVSNANELYFTYLLNKNAKSYQSATNEKLSKQFVDLAKSDLVKKFNSKDWSYTGVSGFKIESLRVASLLASLSSDNSDLTDVKDLVSTAAKNLLKQGVSEENGQFYVLTQAVAQKDSWLSSESVN